MELCSPTSNWCDEWQLILFQEIFLCWHLVKPLLLILYNLLFVQAEACQVNTEVLLKSEAGSSGLFLTNSQHHHSQAWTDLRMAWEFFLLTNWGKTGDVCYHRPSTTGILNFNIHFNELCVSWDLTLSWQCEISITEKKFPKPTTWTIFIVKQKKQTFFHHKSFVVLGLFFFLWTVRNTFIAV